MAIPGATLLACFTLGMSPWGGVAGLAGAATGVGPASRPETTRGGDQPSSGEGGGSTGSVAPAPGADAAQAPPEAPTAPPAAGAAEPGEGEESSETAGAAAEAGAESGDQ